MTIEIIYPPAIYRQSLVKIINDHTRVLDVPGRPAPANLRIPIAAVAIPVSVPENEIPEVPLYTGICILVKPYLLLRPLRHIETEQLSKALEFQRIKIYIIEIPVGYT